MKVKILSNQQGVCPYCNETEIYYDSAEFEDDMVCYKATCQSCKRSFEEWYHLKFAGHNVGYLGQYLAENVLNKEIEY
jgi:hypothetical protein